MANANELGRVQANIMGAVKSLLGTRNPDGTVCTISILEKTVGVVV